MADFMTNLWNAVFEAGPTPTLLLATNATFATLQAVLFALLVATYSIHFVILSILCAGLWMAINWFAAELQAAQQQEETADGMHKRQEEGKDNALGGRIVDTTLTSEAVRHNQTESSDLAAGPKEAADAKGRGITKPARTTGKTTSSTLDNQEATLHNIRQRNTQDNNVDSCGDPSTDSDWEQIDGDR